MAQWLALRRLQVPRFASRLRLFSSQSPELRRDGDDIVSWLGGVTPTQGFDYQLMEQAATKWSNKTALECGVTGKSYSYGTLKDLWRRCGGALQGRNIGKGDVVAVLMLNSPDCAVMFGGIFASGAIPSPINSAFTPVEVARQVQNSGAKVLVADSRLSPIAEAALAQLPQPAPTLLLAGGTDGGREDILAQAEDKGTPFAKDVEVHDDEACVLMYSSGTTGVPKGSITSQGAIRHNIAAVLDPRVNVYQPTTETGQETVLGLMPFFHAFGIYTVLNCSMLQGAKIVTLPMFIPELFLSSIIKHKVGVLHVVPPILQFLVSNPDVTSDDLACLRAVMCTAAPCPAMAAAALKEKAPNDVFFQEAYGMTETMPTHYTPLGHERLGSCGHLLPGVKARVVDLPSGKPVTTTHTPGEVWIKTPSTMLGYHNNPEASKELLTDDGWVRTGDIGTYDEDGYFYIVDRIKELIKVKATQVSPTELETELLKLDGVLDAGVVGVPDERAGEVPRAYVVRKHEGLTEKDVHQFLDQRVAEHKQLKGGVFFVDELPKSQAGKLLRRVLKEKATQ